MQKVLVTDPAYLVEGTDAWANAIKAGVDLNTPEGLKRFNDSLNAFFENTYKVQACTKETGNGDWMNRVVKTEDTDEVSTEGSFGADSGTVSVIEVNDEFQKHLDENKKEYDRLKSLGLIQTIEINNNEPIDLAISTKNKDWSVVQIFQNGKLIAASSDLSPR